MMKKKQQLLLLVILLIFNSLNAQKSRVRQADSYFENFSYAKAIIAYKNLKYKSPRVYRNIAKSYLMLGHTDKAEEYYNELINTGKYNASDLYSLASVLQMNKKYEEASSWMQKYAQRNPADSRGRRFVENPTYYEELIVIDTTVSLNNLAINTKYQDFSPTYYKKDKVAFASSRDDSYFVNRKWNGNNQPFLDLYIADLQDNNVLSNVRKFSKKVNKKFHDAPATFNKDGNVMIITRNNYEKIIAKKGKVCDNNLMLYESILSDKQVWSNPEKLSFNNKNYSCGQASLTPDGQTMYFASNMPGGFGGTDIYIVKRTADGTWGKPKNLGNRINTEGNEMFPYFDEKNNFLFYSSNGLPGLGGLDVFVAKVRRDGSFTLPTNLGAPVNTNKDDFSFIYKIDGSGFLSSNRDGGKGDDDIYGFVNLHKFKSRINEMYLSGVIIDKNTGEPLKYTRVILYDKAGNMVGDFETKEDGKYDYPIDYGKSYTMVVEHSGYDKKETLINTKETGKKDIVRNFEFIKIKTNEDKLKELCAIRIAPLYFNLDKYYILDVEKPTLDRIVAILNKYPAIILEVSSYTDSRASKRYNKRLSKRRTKAVVKYLVSKGIDKDRLVSKWFGEENLVNACADGVKCSEKEHQMNRRSEFKILNCNKE